ncbi:permease prefix domain 1-containing protein [Robertmurraya korlensis]|uniref:permease prefix domain 1-containing protein n=1 Tax=Robertmurraya korlensis TaxID=519977 RepID=UPI0008256110|nr:permease prefix domain 1-containing protein [Robertmurraya korlensis]
MKQIESYVDEVYHSVGGNKKEIEELKEEMKNHLLEAVHELRTQGISEQEAIEIAINRFGGETEMRSVVRQLFKAQKVFAKSVLNIAVILLILSITVFGGIYVVEERNSSETSNVASDISSLLQGESTISADMDNEIQQLVQGTDQISNIKIYNVREVKREFKGNITTYEYTKKASPTYEYERIVWAPGWLYNYGPYEIGDKEWYIAMEVKRLGSIVPLVALLGVTIYITLFTIWATINAYHHKRLNIGWIFAFTLFNFVGYLIYVLVGKKKETA